MTSLPDDALVVRGGRNLPESFVQGAGVTLDAGERLQGVSVNAGAGVSLEQLTASDLRSGYPGVPHNRVGVTTVGAVRAAGGDVVPSPLPANPYHATLHGVTAERGASLFQPTVPNPNRRGR